MSKSEVQAKDEEIARLRKMLLRVIARCGGWIGCVAQSPAGKAEIEDIRRWLEELRKALTDE